VRGEEAESIIWERLDRTSNSPANVFELGSADSTDLSAVYCANGDLMASSMGGCIRYYHNQKLTEYQWGGTYAGFADGLMLAAVDWENDGDVDCICGTSDGRLMLLVNSNIGVPKDVRAAPGVNDVVLTWDIDVQSSLRGFNVYRSVAGENCYQKICEGCPISAFCDTPGEIGLYDYKITSLSRYYNRDDPLPQVLESIASKPICVALGAVKFFWNDVVCKVGEVASVMLSIENSLNYDVAGRVQVVSYDAAYLEPVEIIPSGLTEGIKYSHSFADGKWTITLTAGSFLRVAESSSHSSSERLNPARRKLATQRSRSPRHRPISWATSTATARSMKTICAFLPSSRTALVESIIPISFVRVTLTATANSTTPTIRRCGIC